jgi:hypothetical protein
VARRVQSRNVMKGTSEFAVGSDDDELIERWFEQSDLSAVPGVDPDNGVSDGRRAWSPRFGIVIGGVSATALAVVLIFVIRI